VRDGDAALVVGAARAADLGALAGHGVKRVELVLLTHHHRDASALAGAWAERGIAVRAPAASAPWLTVEGVRDFWERALPRPAVGYQPPLKERTFNEWVYLVHPVGLAEVQCDIADGEQIAWRGWRLAAIAAPGHSRDHTAYVAVRKGDGDERRVLLCGDALATAGTMWSPYTTDWEHWSGRGLQAAFESLRRLAAERPEVVCPEHGPAIVDGAADAIYRTALNVAEAGFLKSYERYSKERLGDPPAVSYLARGQVVTAGDEPWTELSPHLFLTGNTFALAADDGRLLLIDAYGPRIAEQVAKLQDERRLGPVEWVLVSHAHNDHYLGIYLLPDRESFQVGTLDEVAAAASAPYRWCAPYLDARPLAIDRRFADGERWEWGGHELALHHLPGQTRFAMGVEGVIDGRRVLFTGDNFYHADQFSGSGGWSGRNRGLPLPYAASARKVLALSPEWVLAEHGGAFTFSAEDFQRRARWAEAAAAAADALAPSGDHRRDWDPQRVCCEPLLTQSGRGSEANVEVVVTNSGSEAETLSVRLEGRGIVEDRHMEVTAGPGETARQRLSIAILAAAPLGRHVLPLVVLEGNVEDGADTFVVVDVAR
jgi:glyoxylase-like metal-dependent hydrolase (beta-lactamase superfamily II)